MPDHDVKPFSNGKVFDAAPEAFGLVWAYSRVVNGSRRIFIAEGETGAYADAYRRCRPEMRNLGYSYAEPYIGDDFKGTRPCFWLSPAGWSPAALDAAKALVPVRIREEKERYARLDAEREARAAAEVARNEAFIENARQATRDSIRTRRWSWARAVDLDEAGALLAKPDLTVEEAYRLLLLVKRAKDNVSRAEDRIAIPYLPELELARDPAIRAAAHEGCQLLTARDADWASVRNKSGWGKATTMDGHVVAGQESLDEAKKSHALRLLRVHRKQLPSDLADRVFGAVAVAA